MTALLQSGVPFNLELLLTVAIAVLQVVVVMVIVIYRDAKDRNSNHALAWAVSAFFGGLVVWILYFVVRDELGSGQAPGTAHV